MRLLFIIFSILIISCAESKISIEKGTFQTMKPPNIYGSGRYLPNDTNRIISYNANIGKNKTIALPEFTNPSHDVSYEAQLEETSGNINYRLIENTLGFQYYRVIKNGDLYTGWGVGIQNFPYGVFMFGLNDENIEIGSAIYLGLALDKASYEGQWGYYRSSGPINAPTEYNEYIKLKDIYILHTYGGINFYASYFWDKFAINYSGSISNPWLVDELPVTGEYDADISFIFPFLFMHDLGISYTPNNIKYRLGINYINGFKFPGRYFGASLEMAYLW